MGPSSRMPTACGQFPLHCFWGRRHCIGVNADRGHHGEGEHDERYVAPPSMKGARLVVIEAEFVLRGFETIFDRPPMPFDFRQRFDRRSARRPCGEEGEIAVANLTTDQQSACPDRADLCRVVFGYVEIGEFEIGPVVQSLALGSAPAERRRHAEAGKASAMSLAVPATCRALPQE